jgi:hypothetical protein
VQAAFGNQLSSDYRREAVHVEGKQTLAFGPTAAPITAASFFLGRLDVAHQGERGLAAMVLHHFAIGQKVRFKPDYGQMARRDETFVVTRQLPEASGVFQYHVKSEIDGHNRVARED